MSSSKKNKNIEFQNGKHTFKNSKQTCFALATYQLLAACHVFYGIYAATEGNFDGRIRPIAAYLQGVLRAAYQERKIRDPLTLPYSIPAHYSWVNGFGAHQDAYEYILNLLQGLSRECCWNILPSSVLRNCAGPNSAESLIDRLFTTTTVTTTSSSGAPDIRNHEFLRAVMCTVPKGTFPTIEECLAVEIDSPERIVHNQRIMTRTTHLTRVPPYFLGVGTAFHIAAARVRFQRVASDVHIPTPLSPIVLAASIFINSVSANQQKRWHDVGITHPSVVSAYTHTHTHIYDFDIFDEEHRHRDDTVW